MISSQSDRALRQETNSIEIGQTAFEQWRIQWTHPMFRAANIGSSFKTVLDGYMVTMKHYLEVDIGGLSEYDLG